MIKTILVPATGSASDPSVFASALAVARAFEAHLDFLYTGIDAVTIGAMLTSEATSAKLIADLIERVETGANQRERQAKQLFESFCQSEQVVVAETPASRSTPSAAWVSEIDTEPDRVTKYGRAADLIVIGRPESGDSVRSETLQAALLNSGRPLLIPAVSPITALPPIVVIAWKATPEAARAVAAAMPFLSQAKQVVIMTVAEGETESEKDGASRLMTTLQWHGFPVSVLRLEPKSLGPADTLLAAAREQGAVLVMGGYGHSRLREWIFGGFTQRVLHGAEVPVLIAH
ncbi:MAG: universal stress protein [Stellaceae bacterium]